MQKRVGQKKKKKVETETKKFNYFVLDPNIQFNMSDSEFTQKDNKFEKLQVLFFLIIDSFT